MYSYSTVPSCVFYLPTYSPINLCMCSLRVVLNPFSILDDATSRVHPGGLHNRVGWVGRILRALDFCYLVAPQTHILWTLCWLVVQIIHDLWPAKKNTPRRPHRTPHSTKKAIRIDSPVVCGSFLAERCSVLRSWYLARSSA